MKPKDIKLNDMYGMSCSSKNNRLVYVLENVEGANGGFHHVFKGVKQMKKAIDFLQRSIEFIEKKESK